MHDAQLHNAAHAAQAPYGAEASLVALFTFVARDPLSKSALAINPLVPGTDADKALFAERQRVADERRAARRAAGAGASSSGALVARCMSAAACSLQKVLRSHSRSYQQPGTQLMEVDPGGSQG
jgi:hypothetical protein